MSVQHVRRRPALHAARDRGAAAVEMAIVLPVLVALTFGIIDFGRILNAEIQLSQGAREGVRIAALAAGNTSYTKAAVRDRAQLAAPNPGFGGTTTVLDSNISLCTTGFDPLATATVTATVQFSGILYTPGNGTLKQTAVMRCGG